MQDGLQRAFSRNVWATPLHNLKDTHPHTIFNQAFDVRKNLMLICFAHAVIFGACSKARLSLFSQSATVNDGKLMLKWTLKQLTVQLPHRKMKLSNPSLPKSSYRLSLRLNGSAGTRLHCD